MGVLLRTLRLLQLKTLLRKILSVLLDSGVFASSRVGVDKGVLESGVDLEGLLDGVLQHGVALANFVLPAFFVLLALFCCDGLLKQ